AREAAKMAAATATSTHTAITKEKKHETRRCGNCGQSGHMKTNKKVPAIWTKFNR
ncbi:4626_t:CDS:2, partial [Dentiscutata heterogama]